MSDAVLVGVVAVVFVVLWAAWAAYLIRVIGQLEAERDQLLEERQLREAAVVERIRRMPGPEYQDLGRDPTRTAAIDLDQSLPQPDHWGVVDRDDWGVKL